MLKKTKIVCTMGPATDKDGIIEQLMENGMNCARFNFSHGDHKEQLRRINNVRAAMAKTDKLVALLLDTKGPEIRLGLFPDGPVMLEKGQEFTLVNENIPGDKYKAHVNYDNLYNEVKPGDTILLSDGLVGLTVKEIKGKDIVAEVLNDGKMSDRKRVAVPGVSLGLPPISEQDEKDLIFGVENDMDFVAASFIQRASDVEAIRKIIHEHGGHMEIISKIENMEGVKNIDAIIEASDGIMVARGDLGVEVPAEEVPIIQKDIIKKCSQAGKIVIVATQMLESMTTNPRPTRAEVSDVANAIMDGTDAIMLSGETASGNYPVEAVKTMNSIATRVESSLHYKSSLTSRGFQYTHVVISAVAHSAVQLALELNAKAIITRTVSGFTAMKISSFRPRAAILTFAYSEMVARHLQLRWGVQVMNACIWEDVKDPAGEAVRFAVRNNYLEKGDIAVIAAGMQQVDGKMEASVEIRTVDN